jgi:hypothetical protein
VISPLRCGIDEYKPEATLAKSCCLLDLNLTSVSTMTVLAWCAVRTSPRLRLSSRRCRSQFVLASAEHLSWAHGQVGAPLSVVQFSPVCIRRCADLGDTKLSSMRGVMDGVRNLLARPFLVMCLGLDGTRDAALLPYRREPKSPSQEDLVTENQAMCIASII